MKTPMTNKPAHPKNYYINLRNRFFPKDLKAIFVLESPPASGRYFYNPDGRTGEPLFSAMMRSVLGLDPHSAAKAEGLRKFQEAGYLVVDAAYIPVNKMDDKERDRVILENLGNLVEDLREQMRKAGKDSAPVILVKANICRLLESRLLERGFRVANQGSVIPFPSNGQQKVFERKIQELI